MSAHTSAHHAAILPPPREPLPRIWLAAGLFIILAHAGLFYWMIHEKFFAAAPGAPPAAVMVDLAPMPEEPPMQLPAEVPPEVVEPEPEPEEAVIIPEPPPRVPKAAAVLIVRPKPAPKRVAKPQKPSDRPTQNASAAAGAPTSGASVTSGASNASWHAMVAAHLQRHKPSSAQDKGTCMVAFSVDRSGRVLGARLSSSSGSAALDRLAVAAVQSASPVPAPPADVLGGHFPFNVPIRFR
jgi:protein TonB